MNRISVGDRAPLWTLIDQYEKKISLKDCLGKKNVLLSFHPLAWTSVCSRQMKDLEAGFDELSLNNTVAFGLSVDSVPCKAAWARSLGVTQTSLPSDFWPHGAVSVMYGVFFEKFGYSRRSAFIIDRDGVIAFRKTYRTAELPDIREIINEVKKISGKEPAAKKKPAY